MRNYKYDFSLLLLHRTLFDIVLYNRIMPIIRERGIFMLGARFLNRFHIDLQQPPLLKIVEALSLLADSEDFSTYRERHIPLEQENIEILSSLKEHCLSGLLTSENRKIARPLADAIDKAKRSFSLTSRK